jgi:hypothetical protein
MEVKPKMALVGKPFELDNRPMAWKALNMYELPSMRKRRDFSDIVNHFL